jgi:2-polyprenyl-3-methyl-5-hydroxy-6-metoxy-1,4-benzoquinol methylase
MKDNDIRPQYLMVKQRKLFQLDALNLIKFKNKFIKVNCPACGSSNNSFFLKKISFIYKICNRCKTFFMTPRPNDETLLIYYNISKNLNYWAKYIFPISKKKRIKYIFKPRANLIKEIVFKNLKKKNITYLEIGPGDGSLAVELKKINIFSEIKLIEPNSKLARFISSKGINVENTTYEKYIETQNSKKYDCIGFFEVIEHINDPFFFLKNVNKMLTKKGLVIFSCPNGEGFDVAMMQESSNVIDHEHLNYFNINSISQLLKRSGFDILKISTPGKLDVELVKNFSLLKKNKNELFNHRVSWLNKISDSEIKILQKWIVRNKLSSHMFIVAKKNKQFQN